jgi:hypothetical protein
MNEPANAVQMPERLWRPIQEMALPYATTVGHGISWLTTQHVAIVGLARNCGGALAQNLERVMSFGQMAKSWRLHIEANDCVDNTLQVLTTFSQKNARVTFHYRDLGHAQFGAEFAGRRTEAMATHRTACQKWVRSLTQQPDLVLVVDFDLWGGWNEHGLLNGIGWLRHMPEAFGMASVSLFQFNFGSGIDWFHYDLWALRGVGQQDCYFDTYQKGYGSFGYTFTPPVGSPPVLVSSAFGGMAVYRAADYLAGTYDGSDCEHVPFHRSIAGTTGRRLYLCPGMRTAVTWMQ